MISTIVSRLVILVFGTLYPAYASYKAVRTKNVKEYVKWMMYWIVFALFTCAETFTDVFLSWFPFYYEIKIILVLWLLSPATKGSSILYRKFVHPMLSRREQEIDDYIAKAKEQGYHTVLNLGTKGVNYATTVIMQTAIKGGGGIVNQLRKSYSLSDLTDDTDSRADARGLQDRLADESSDVVDPRHVRRRHSPRRSASGSSRVDMYFPEVDIRPGPVLSHVRSTEDVSSGYSSAEPLYVGQPPKLEAREGLVRTASMGGTSRPRTRTTRTSLSTKKATLPEDSEESESDSEITIIQQFSMTSQKVKRTYIIHEESESSENSNEFEDTIGFPAESTPVKIQEIVEQPINEPIKKPIIEPDDKVEASIIEPIQDSIVELNDKIEAIVEVQIEKEASVDIFEDTVETNEAEKEEIITNKNVEDQIVSVESITATDNDIDVSNSQRGGKYNKHTAPVPPATPDKIENVPEPLPVPEPSTKTVSDSEVNESIVSKPESSEQSVEKSDNLEKVDKKDPPELSESARSSDAETHPIKATLVLKPGIIKSVGPPTEESNKTQIFVSQSPKAKRKTKSKHDSPISRLMMLPKKIFGNKDSSNENLKDKRKSWHADTRSLTPSSLEDLKSKSDTEDMYEPIDYLGEERKSVSAADIANKRHEENKMILRTLSHSPKQYRRKTKEDYDYEDSD